MKPAKIAVICIAAVAAIGLALVVRAMGSSSGAPAATAVAAVEAVPMAKVLVAAKNLEPGSRLTDADLTWKDWPIAEVNPVFITDGSVPIPGAAAEGAAKEAKPVDDKADKVKKAEDAAARVSRAATALATGGAKADYIGAVVREPILAGEPIVARKIVRAGDSGFMAAYLEPGMRAMAIRVTVETAAGGFILPGDRADVLLTRQVKMPAGSASGEDTKFVSATVMQNVKVLAIDQATRAADDAQAVVGATATLEISGRDAEVLALAKSEGELSLVLRSYADTAGPSGRTPAATRRSDAAANVVRVYREGQAEAVVVR
ncbi:Flp pilus assembly protein CpaB [Brevundimonas bullata]|uniref:Flp pilus assembly protein CpaB n=1 Tax=Brevundimonas bullata TaxID=13160 RepID=UPI000E09EF21|nr:Flp pilus assembly protein CpaB [Brevundimonas bullata]WQE36449.1 Flp pilus assembly protein CpaB [Brevundimonas bullata]